MCWSQANSECGLVGYKSCIGVSACGAVDEMIATKTVLLRTRAVVSKQQSIWATRVALGLVLVVAQMERLLRRVTLAMVYAVISKQQQLWATRDALVVRMLVAELVEQWATRVVRLGTAVVAYREQ